MILQMSQFRTNPWRCSACHTINSAYDNNCINCVRLDLAIDQAELDRTHKKVMDHVNHLVASGVVV